MLLLIDNYDSFVYNLARYLEELGCETVVVRNDAVDVDAVRKMAPQAIVISPGPCTPNEAGVSVGVISGLSESVPILGVCLGHQAIAAALGGTVVRATEPVHGRSSLVRHSGEGLFAGLPSPLRVGRYHSLIVEESTLPTDLVVTARTDEGTIMAFQHRTRPLFGVQFHPESVLTQAGRSLLANFVRGAGLMPRDCPTIDWLEPDVGVEDRGLSVVTW